MGDILALLAIGGLMFFMMRRGGGCCGGHSHSNHGSNNNGNSCHGNTTTGVNPNDNNKSQIDVAKDPICGMYVSKNDAVRYVLNGHTYHFCSQDCKNEFVKIKE